MLFSNLVFVHSFMQFLVKFVRAVIFYIKLSLFLFIRVIDILVTHEFLALKSDFFFILKETFA